MDHQESNPVFWSQFAPVEGIETISFLYSPCGSMSQFAPVEGIETCLVAAFSTCYMSQFAPVEGIETHIALEPLPNGNVAIRAR